MEPIYFVMAILGCADGNTQCQEARVEPVRYATVAECRAALPTALARNTDLSFPVIAANCRQNGLSIAAAEKPAKRG